MSFSPASGGGKRHKIIPLHFRTKMSSGDGGAAGIPLDIGSGAKDRFFPAEGGEKTNTHAFRKRAPLTSAIICIIMVLRIYPANGIL